MRDATEMPPTPHYALSDANRMRVGDALGRVAYTRTMREDTQGSAPVAWVNPQHSLRGWLTELGGDATTELCEFRCEHEVTWVGKQKLRTEVREAQRKVQRAFTAAVRELRKVGVLRPQQVRGLEARVELRITDRRGREHVPSLPADAWLLGPAKRLW